MRYTTTRCPECGEVPHHTVERLYADALLSEPDENSNQEYAGGSDVHWDSQAPVRDADGRVTLSCGEHEWQASEETTITPYELYDTPFGIALDGGAGDPDSW